MSDFREELAKLGADPANTRLRLLRAVFGLCPECDSEEPHEHEERKEEEC